MAGSAELCTQLHWWLLWLLAEGSPFGSLMYYTGTFKVWLCSNDVEKVQIMLRDAFIISKQLRADWLSNTQTPPDLKLSADIQASKMFWLWLMPPKVRKAPFYFSVFCALDARCSDL
jgi:hypothetical protein